MDVTFVLEESGVTATVEVPCEGNAAAAKEVACTALAVSPASVEMRIGTEVLEGTCRLQDTAFDAGVQVVLARRFADIKCPAEYNVREYCMLSLSRCGSLCLYCVRGRHVHGFDTETFDTAFEHFTVEDHVLFPPAISRCKTRCYLAFEQRLAEVALPDGEVLRTVDGPSSAVFACGSVVVSKGDDGVSVYDEDLTLLRSLSHEGCSAVAVSDCGGWVLSSSSTGNARLWDVNRGESVACVPADKGFVALSRSASVFAVGFPNEMRLYDWSGAALGSFKEEQCCALGVQFTPCGKYLVVEFEEGGDGGEYTALHQYDVATMSCVRMIRQVYGAFVISPCSRVVMFESSNSSALSTRHLFPY